MRLLIIRPEPGAGASARRAAAAGFEPILLPFFEIKPVPWIVPNPAEFDALFLTSANAVRQAGEGLEKLRSLPVHCVGEKTADAARAVGLKLASVGASDAGEMLQNAATAGDRRLFWLVGLDHMPSPSRGDMEVVRAICYESGAKTLPDNAGATIAAADAVALHSSRAARLFSETIATMGLEKSQFYLGAFSAAIADEAGEGWRGVAVAEHPLDNALLSALSALDRLDTKALGRKEDI